MRRRDREGDAGSAEKILFSAPVCRLGLWDGEEVYIVPVNFVYERGEIFFHSAIEGRKMDILRKNPRLSFEADIYGGVKPGKTACGYGTVYECVMGTGSAELIEDARTKSEILSRIMDKYAFKTASFDVSALSVAAAVRIKVEGLSCKISPYL